MEDNLACKICSQIKYYFSDNNLIRDKFMKEKSKENDGWISLDCLLTFNRLKQLSTDKDFIVSCLEENKNEKLEVDKEKYAIRRNPLHPVPEETPKEYFYKVRPKTVLLKGFPNNNDISVEVLEKFLATNNINSYEEIKLMRNNDKEFMGKVYLQLKTETEAEELLAQDVELEFTHDEQNYKIEKIYLKQHREFAVKKSEEEARKRFYEQINYDEENKTSKCGFLPGKVLHFKNNDAPSLKREDIKSVIGEKAKIGWVEFNQGDTEGFIELSEGGDAIKVFNEFKTDDSSKASVSVKPENGETVNIEIEVLEGKPEIAYWRGKIEKKSKKKTFQKRKRMENRSMKPAGKHTKFSDDTNEVTECVESAVTPGDDADK